MEAVLMAGAIASASESTLDRLLDNWELAWYEAADALSWGARLRWAAHLDELEAKLPSAVGTQRSRDEVLADLRGATLDMKTAETLSAVRQATARIKRLQVELTLAGEP